MVSILIEKFVGLNWFFLLNQRSRLKNDGLLLLKDEICHSVEFGIGRVVDWSLVL